MRVVYKVGLGEGKKKKKIYICRGLIVNGWEYDEAVRPHTSPARRELDRWWGYIWVTDPVENIGGGGSVMPTYGLSRR